MGFVLRAVAAEPLLPNRYHRNPLPHSAAVASSSRTAAAEQLPPNCGCRTAAAELRLLHGYQRSVAAATYHRTPNRCCRTATAPRTAATAAAVIRSGL